MIPPNYIPSDPDRESERTKAARALVAAFVGTRKKIAMRPLDATETPACLSGILPNPGKSS